MSKTQRFFRDLSILTVLMALASVSLVQMGWLALHAYHWLILAYNVVLTGLSFLMLRNGLGQKDGFEFFNRFMGNATVRLLLTAAVLFIYFYAVKTEAKLFTITFFAFYFIYTIFEIQHLLANLRQNSESLGNTDGKSTDEKSS